MSLQNTYQKQNYICFWEGCEHRFNNVKELIIHLKEIHIKILSIESPLFHCQWGDCKSDESSQENLLNHVMEKHCNLSTQQSSQMQSQQSSLEQTSTISKQVSTESTMNQKSTLQNISESVQQKPDTQLELQSNQQNQQIEESQRMVCTQIQKLQLDTVPPDSSRQVNTVETKEIVIIDDDESTVYKPTQVANTVSATQQATNNRIPVMRGFDIRPRQMAQTQHFSYLPATQGHSVPNQVQTSSQHFQVSSQMAQVPSQIAQIPNQMVQVSSRRTQVPNQRAQVPSQRTQVPSQRVQIPNQRVQMGANTSPYNSNLRYHSAQQGANMIRPSQQISHSSGLPLVQTHQDGNVIRIIQQENDMLRRANVALQESHSKLMRENEQLIIELQNLKAKIAVQEAQPRYNNENLITELQKMKTQLMLQDSQLKMTEEELVYHKRITSLITEQNRRADSKLRSIWVDLLCQKARAKLNNEKMMTERSALKRTREENDMQDSITGTIPKRSRENEESSKDEALEKSKGTKGIDENNNNQEKMDIEPSERSDSTECDISVITEAYVCQWNGCGKVFRTKLALKAHIPSEHIGVGSLRVRVDKP
ncbi:6559_t:CDS:2 [Dentiscutata erythropus]|uniref:6559_t:CDS:1 n=1 Tax=Dentiscutata erythropus TaxID=1348616 RepID=A0A9N9E1L2_9GLOM|nr:6559_t:CDS:2 [Dentiscutata erythropus]